MDDPNVVADEGPKPVDLFEDALTEYFKDAGEDGDVTWFEQLDDEEVLEETEEPGEGIEEVIDACTEALKVLYGDNRACIVVYHPLEPEETAEKPTD